MFCFLFGYTKFKFGIFELLGQFCTKSRVNSTNLMSVYFQLHSLKCWCSGHLQNHNLTASNSPKSLDLEMWQQWNNICGFCWYDIIIISLNYFTDHNTVFKCWNRNTSSRIQLVNKQFRGIRIYKLIEYSWYR